MDTLILFGIFLTHFIEFTTPEVKQPFLAKEALWQQTHATKTFSANELNKF
jgi:hypothetical protein